MDVFDLTRNPDQIGPAWAFFLFFVAIDIVRLEIRQRACPVAPNSY